MTIRRFPSSKESWESGRFRCLASRRHTVKSIRVAPNAQSYTSFRCILLTGENDSDEILTQALPAVEGCKTPVRLLGPLLEFNQRGAELGREPEFASRNPTTS